MCFFVVDWFHFFSFVMNYLSPFSFETSAIPNSLYKSPDITPIDGAAFQGNWFCLLLNLLQIVNGVALMLVSAYLQNMLIRAQRGRNISMYKYFLQKETKSSQTMCCCTFNICRQWWTGPWKPCHSIICESLCWHPDLFMSARWTNAGEIVASNISIIWLRI